MSLHQREDSPSQVWFDAHDTTARKVRLTLTADSSGLEMVVIAELRVETLGTPPPPLPPAGPGPEETTQGASFQGLGDAPGGGFLSRAHGVSPDGCVVTTLMSSAEVGGHGFGSCGAVPADGAADVSAGGVHVVGRIGGQASRVVLGQAPRPHFSPRLVAGALRKQSELCRLVRLRARNQPDDRPSREGGSGLAKRPAHG